MSRYYLRSQEISRGPMLAGGLYIYTSIYITFGGGGGHRRTGTNMFFGFQYSVVFHTSELLKGVPCIAQQTNSREPSPLRHARRKDDGSSRRSPFRAKLPNKRQQEQLETYKDIYILVCIYCLRSFKIFERACVS